jgi:ABC-2 type transport system permease protein
MKKIWTQFIKELAQFRRDRLTLTLAFLLPLMTLIIFGFAIRLEAKNIPLVVQDFDNTPLSRAYTERLFTTNQFHAVPWQGKSPVIALDQGIAKAAVIIPPELTRRIKADKPSEVQVLIDGSDVHRFLNLGIRVCRRSLTFIDWDSTFFNEHCSFWFIDWCTSE